MGDCGADELDWSEAPALTSATDGGSEEPSPVPSPADAPDRWFGLETRRSRAALAVALAFVALVRLLPLPQVYQHGDIVLSSNDPYYYRFWVERLSAQAGLVDPRLFAGLPGAVANGEPLMIVTLGWFVNLSGGGSTASGVILALYPVVSALVTGVVVYLLAVRVTVDRRIGLAAVGLFAVIPGHAFRTGLGFADHHAFDYLWLALTAFALVALLTRRDGDRAVLLAGLLGVAVAAQTLAWEASPLLLLPLAVAIAVVAPLELHRGRDPTRILAPVGGGLAFATALVLAAHAGLGWHSRIVAAAPVLVLAGTVGVLVATLAVERVGLSARALVVIEVLGLAVTTLAMTRLIAPLTGRVGRRLAFLFGATGIAETTSVVGEFGFVSGPLIMLGFTPLLGVPAMAWAAGRAVGRGEAALAALTVYAWYFLGLSVVQRRFVGELAPFIAVFAGLGFVALVAWLDLARPPAPLRTPGTDESERVAGTEAELASAPAALELPGRRRVAVLGTLAVVGTGFPMAFAANIHSRVTIDPRAYRAARWMREYAADRGWTYPENYVFSEWGRNRMYNYFVSGQSRSYSYAQDKYGDFLLSSEAETWYDRLQGRTGFVVTRSIGADLAPTRLYHRLHKQLGSGSESVPGLAHFRAMYASQDGEVKVFTLVPGATITGESNASQLSLETDFELAVSRPEGELESASFTYRRRIESTEEVFAVTVAHPGTYIFQTVEGRTLGEARVSERAVLNGERLEVALEGS